MAKQQSSQQTKGQSGQIPIDRLYSRNHFWLQSGAGGFRVGMTERAGLALPADFLIEWTIPAGIVVRERQEIGRLETVQGFVPLLSPAAGRILNFNDQLQDEPTLLRTDPYGLGWLLHLETDARFLTAVEYAELVARKS